MKVLQLTYRASGLSALAGLAVLATSTAALAQAPTTEPPVIQPLPAEPPPPPPPTPAYPPPPPSELAPPPPMAASLDPHRVPPAPRLQTLPTQDLDAARAEEDRTLTSYGWVDEHAGTVRIPIAEAMRLLAERGEAPLPKTAPDASPSPGTAPAAPAPRAHP